MLVVLYRLAPCVGQKEQYCLKDIEAECVLPSVIMFGFHDTAPPYPCDMVYLDGGTKPLHPDRAFIYLQMSPDNLTTVSQLVGPYLVRETEDCGPNIDKRSQQLYSLCEVWLCKDSIFTKYYYEVLELIQVLRGYLCYYMNIMHDIFCKCVMKQCNNG